MQHLIQQRLARKPAGLRNTAILGPTIALLILVMTISPASAAQPQAPLAAALTDAQAQGEAASSSNGLHSVYACDPETMRSVDRLVVEAGESLEVLVDYHYRCSRQSRKLNYFLLVENTEVLRGAGVSRDLLGNLKDAMTGFVNRVDYDNGSRGGLTLYADDYTNRVTLRGERSGKLAMLQAIRSISVEPIGNSAGAPAAIRHTTERLPTGIDDEEATNVLIVVDGGAPVTTRPIIDYETACGAAHDAGVVLVVIGLKEAGSRGSGCASRGWFRQSGNEDGEDLEGIFLELADSLITGKKAQADEFADWISPEFDYVQGSGEPREPDMSLGREQIWSFESSGTAASRQIRYRLRASENAGNRIVPVSREAGVSLFYSDGSRSRVEAEIPEICIHERGDEGFCAGFGEQETPTPTRPAPEPTPTEDDPTPEPSREPSETPEPPAPTTPTPIDPGSGNDQRTIYLPIAGKLANASDFPAPRTPLPATATSLPEPTAEPTEEPSPTEPPTAEPTEAPTEVPTETPPPLPSPTPTQTLNCRELLTNGNFEDGAKNWTLTVTTQRQQLSRSIQHRSKVPMTPRDGDYLAWLGGLDGTYFELKSDRLAAVDPEKVVSATLSYYVAMATQERLDRRDGDKLTFHLGSGTRGEVREAAISEEDLPEGYRWYPFVHDVTDRFQAGRVTELSMKFTLDASNTSWVYYDQVSIQACE